MRAVDIIIKKRDGGALTREEISFFVSGVTEGIWPDYQASSLLMAIVLRGMTPQETAWLTDAMVKSGIVWDDKTLVEYLKDSKGRVLGTKMVYVGLK